MAGVRRENERLSDNIMREKKERKGRRATVRRRITLQLLSLEAKCPPHT